MKKLFTFLLFVLVSATAFTQTKLDRSSYDLKKGKTVQIEMLSPVQENIHSMPMSAEQFDLNYNFYTSSGSMLHQKLSKVSERDDSGIPLFIEASTIGGASRASGQSEELIYEVLDNTVGKYLGGKTAIETFVPISYQTDTLQIQHIKFQQTLSGIPVFGAEYNAHIKPNGKVTINGRVSPLPSQQTPSPAISISQAESIVKSDLEASGIQLIALDSKWIELMEREQYISELTWYPSPTSGDLNLAFHISTIPNLGEKWEYFIDAVSGQILNRYSGRSQIYGFISDNTLKKFEEENERTNHFTEALWMNGPRTAQATDIFGIQRTINTYQQGSQFFMLDASRPMYVNGSIPNNPQGVLLTMDCNGSAPFGTSFNPIEVISANNTWPNRNSVSTHYHTMLTYDFFRNTLNRSSYDNQGANMISFFNMPDENGQAFDNAFWMQRFSFFGNGRSLFIRPLSAALDVVAHEFGHGLVQETAALIYQDEPGALNEMYADLCGVLVNGNNWRMATAVVNTNFFSSGAMRDLGNPANGGTNLNDPGYQPGHVNQQYRGTEDYGGVHINSSIPGNAMYRFANRTSIDIMRNVAFRALFHYLTKSSKFVDFRIAIIQAAIDLHGEGSVVQALRQSLDEVGIVGGAGSNTEPVLNPNPGEDFVIAVDSGSDLLFLADGTGADVAYPIADVSPVSRCSVTDDGSAAVYIGSDKRMYLIDMNFQTGDIQSSVLQSDPIWRNVAVSKDGTLLAALTDELNNTIYVFSFAKQEWRSFDLYGISMAPNAPLLDNVLFADAIEWSYDGSVLMYDALNQLTVDETAWDIGFLNVWDKSAGDFANGSIVKMFEGVEQGISIGNPTFAKTAPYIIAFDYLDNQQNTALLGMNLERNELEVIFQNQVLSFPSYASNDSHIIFDAKSTDGRDIIAISGLGTNKITPTGNPSIFINNAHWGVWFANGDRELSTSFEQTEMGEIDLQVFPNPTADRVIVSLKNEQSGDLTLAYNLVNMSGMVVKAGTQISATTNVEFQIDLSDLPSSTYILKVQNAKGSLFKKIVKK